MFEPVVPINPVEVELWFEYMKLTTQNNWGSYKSNLVAVRWYSRDLGFLDVSCLETDLKKSNQSRFAKYIEGLKKQLPVNEVKKAKVVPHSLLVKVMHHMESRFREEHTMMKLRDMVLIANMYLLGLRGCDLYMINEDHVEFDFVERAVDIKLKGGKMTRKRLSMAELLAKAIL